MDYSNVVSLDSETLLFDRGLLAPPIVVVTRCDYNLAPSIHHARENAFEVVRDSLQNNHLCGANFAYDAACIGSTWPELLPLVFEAYFDNRIVDVQLNQRLIDLARGELDGFFDSKGAYHKHLYSLNALSERHGFGSLDKTTWRTGYAEYLDQPLSAMPLSAQEYAKLDAQRTLEVFFKQTEYETYLEDACRQARAAFALHLMSCVGMITDPRACEVFIEKTKEEIELARALCQEHGIVDAKGKRMTKPAKDRMIAACAELGVPVPMTKKAKTAKDTWTPSVCLDAEACLDSGDEVLVAYSTYTSANTLLKKAELLREGSKGLPLQTRFQCLLETGRTSSSAPGAPLVGDNFQNLRTAAGLRECFIPRPGHVLCSIDYDMAELRTVSQIYIWLFGHSPLADALNAGKDVHSMIGARLMRLSYEEFLANKKQPTHKKNRDHGKMGNFSLWGGSSVKTFVTAVNKKTPKKADRITEAVGHQIKGAWQAEWKPEPYFDYVKQCLGDGLATYKSWKSGRIRAHLDYTTTANNGFQALAADAAKSALLPLAAECYTDKNSPLYGSRPLLFVHDEVILSLPEERAHEAAMRARDIMVQKFNEWTPDVPVTAEPTLMRCWSKSAETIYKNGQLQVWEPAA